MGMRLAMVVASGACAACGSSGASDLDARAVVDAHHADAGADAQVFPATLDGDRDRLIASYLAFLQASPATVQSNGLSGAELHTTCDLWSKLDPSSQSVFLTISHRLYGAVLVDGSRALTHITQLYRVAGGQGATATSAGSCGGGEYNRMIMQMDAELHDTQLAANMDQGATPYDLTDMTSDYWRDSHDLGGPHPPFDLSDETNNGAPRGQTQYFRDPTSTLANTALGRVDLMTLVDPFAVEMDEDYDCIHNSNPGCDYITYGPLCAPEADLPGTAVYTQSYGDFEPAWRPTGC